jgi:hypothetical protein
MVLIAACGATAETTTTGGDGVTTAPPSEEVSTVVEASTTSAAVESEADDDPCSLVTSEVVAASFGGTSASGEPGVVRNCSFTIVDGVVTPVEVFHYGSSSGWDEVKSGYEENRGGVTEVPGVGDEAYQPNDVGPYEIVVRSGDVIFAVAVQTGSGGPDVEAALLDLAGVIAGG